LAKTGLTTDEIGDIIDLILNEQDYRSKCERIYHELKRLDEKIPLEG